MDETDVLRAIQDGLKAVPNSPVTGGRTEPLNVSANYAGDWDRATGFTLHNKEGVAFDVIVGMRLPTAAARGG